MSRFTAEFRGVDSIDEWCVVDEDISPVGMAFIFGVDEPTAVALADLANYLYKDTKKSKSLGA
jgi:hypothetical protein